MNKIIKIIFFTSLYCCIQLTAKGELQERKRLCSETSFSEEKSEPKKINHQSDIDILTHTYAALSVTNPRTKRSHCEDNPTDTTNKKIYTQEDRLINSIKQFVDILDEQDLTPLFFLNEIGKRQTEDSTYRIILQHRNNLETLLQNPRFKKRRDIQNLLINITVIEEEAFKHLPFS